MGEIESLVGAIGAVGFPAIISLVLLWFLREILKDHKDEIKGLTTAVNNNSTVMYRILDKLGVDTDEQNR